MKVRPEQPNLETVNGFCHPASLMLRPRSSELCPKSWCTSQEDQRQFEQLAVAIARLVMLPLVFTECNDFVLAISSDAAKSSEKASSHLPWSMDDHCSWNRLSLASTRGYRWNFYQFLLPHHRDQNGSLSTLFPVRTGISLPSQWTARIVFGLDASLMLATTDSQCCWCWWQMVRASACGFYPKALEALKRIIMAALSLGPFRLSIAASWGDITLWHPRFGSEVAVIVWGPGPWDGPSSKPVLLSNTAFSNKTSSSSWDWWYLLFNFFSFSICFFHYWSSTLLTPLWSQAIRSSADIRGRACIFLILNELCSISMCNLKQLLYFGWKWGLIGSLSL